MAYCSKCGAQVDKNMNFCPKCGNPINHKSDSSTYQFDFSKKFDSFINTNDSTTQFDPVDIENNKIWAVLSYFFILFIIPIIVVPNSRYARFHANQGLVLFIFSTLYSISQAFFNSILNLIYLGFLAQLFKLVGLFFLILLVIGVINAATGKAKELPIIGKIKIINY